MVEIRRRRIDSTIEKRIITGMIVSTRYLGEIFTQTDLSYFQNPFAKTVANWCIDYYETYDKAPFLHIKDVFTRELPKIKPEEESIIEDLLEEISQRYELEKGINVEFLLDQTITFFKKRELEITAGNIKVLLDRNQLELAEEEIIQYKKIARLTSKWCDPLEESEVIKTLEEDDNPLFQFPGALGNFLGPMRHSWLVGITGPYKRGKTWLAEEFGVVAFMSGIKVCFISLEMSKSQMNLRIYQRLANVGRKERNYLVPCFDCMLNMTGECNRIERVNEYNLMAPGALVPLHIDPDSPYEPCTWCRDNNLQQDWEPSVWYKSLHREAADKQSVVEQVEGIRKTYGNNFRIKSYPQHSASVSDIMRDLDLLEHTEDFVPEMIIVDYADILRSDHSSLSGHLKEDDVWINLARLAGERRALTITPTQATSDALDIKQVKQQHTARWRGKLGHVDIMLSLNQLEAEKKRGIMRIGVMAHRFEDFHQSLNCTILQQLHLGQVNLDAHIGMIDIEHYA